MRIDAKDISYRELNARIRSAAADGVGEILIENASGQRYIGTGLGRGVSIRINGIPGNDLGAFMNGAEIVVDGNVQDAVANTMNAGRIVVHGDAGDILAHSMRGGEVFVRGSVGYRTGIHMKAYRERRPAVVIGGTADDYLGEYMAGGVIVVLGLNSQDGSPVGEYVGTGMHGGTIFIRGNVEPCQLGREVGVSDLQETDQRVVNDLLSAFCREFDSAGRNVRPDEFVKLFPKSARPYGTLYAY